MRNRVLTLAAAGVLLFGVCATAQDMSSASAGQTDTAKKAKKSTRDIHGETSSATQAGAAGEQSAKSSVRAADRMFVKKAAEGGLAEVQLGQLAADKASSNDVKQFGQRMVDDHGKANDQLKSVATQKGIDLPTELSAKDKSLKDRLAKLSGEQFDRAYMKAMVKDHTMDVGEFKKESKTAKDADVKNFATQTLPTLQSHLDEAKSVASKVGVMTEASGTRKKASKTASASQPE